MYVCVQDKARFYFRQLVEGYAINFFSYIHTYSVYTLNLLYFHTYIHRLEHCHNNGICHRDLKPEVQPHIHTYIHFTVTINVCMYVTNVCMYVLYVCMHVCTYVCMYVYIEYLNPTYIHTFYSLYKCMYVCM